MATVYTIVAWVLVQVGVAVVPIFGAPSWVLQVLVLFLGFGFPVVLILAWAYELTPEGLRRTPEAAHAEIRNSRVFDSVLIVVLIAALGYVTIGAAPWDYGVTSRADELAGTGGGAAQRTTLAIMPFTALSPDANATALAVGLSDSIQGDLNVTHGLVTTGITSTLQATEAQKDRTEIAEVLGVDFLVEGSVRVDDGKAHVFAQLVELPNGEVVWSDQFPFSEQGLEPVRDDIVREIADHAIGQVRPAAEATGLDAASFEEWLQLLGHMRGARKADTPAARVLGEALIEHAPEFGPAYAALAYLHAIEANRSTAVNFEQRVATVNDLLDEAMVQAPSSPRVLLWRARSSSLLMRWRGSESDYERINRMFDKALEAQPLSAESIAAYAEHKLAWSEIQDALQLSQRALELDPLSELAKTVRVQALLQSGKRDLAEAEIDKMESFPGGTELLRARLAVARGNLRDALSAYQQIPAGEGGALGLEAVRLWASIGESERAIQLIESQEETPGRDIWRLALEHKYGEAYALSRSQLSQDHPESALLIGVLAVEANENEAAVGVFSRHFQAWLEGAGPLRGPAAIRYAPWFARALTQVGREAEARRLLDRHLAGLIVVEDELTAAVSGIYFAANYAARGRDDDAGLALELAVDDGFRLTMGALGDPVDITQSNLLSRLEIDPARIRRGEE